MNKNFSLHEEFKALRALHLALVFGLLLICIIMYLLSTEEQLAPITALNGIEVFAIVWSIFCVLMVYWFNRYRLPGVKNISDKDERWTAYRSIKIRKYALIEGAGLFCVVVFFMRYNLYLLLFALVLDVLLYLMRPRKEKLFNELGYDEGDWGNSST